jgi:hypothetical protein
LSARSIALFHGLFDCHANVIGKAAVVPCEAANGPVLFLAIKIAIKFSAIVLIRLGRGDHKYPMIEYRPIVGFEGYYEISRAGDVRSLERWVKANSGLRLEPARTMTRSADQVSLSRAGKCRRRTVWKLVLQAFPDVTEFEGKLISDRQCDWTDDERKEREKASKAKYAAKADSERRQRATEAQARYRAKTRVEKPEREPKPIVPKRVKTIATDFADVLSRPRKAGKPIGEERSWTPPKVVRTIVDPERMRAFAKAGVSLASIAAAFSLPIETVQEALNAA